MRLPARREIPRERESPREVAGLAENAPDHSGELANLNVLEPEVSEKRIVRRVACPRDELLRSGREEPLLEARVHANRIVEPGDGTDRRRQRSGRRGREQRPDQGIDVAMLEEEGLGVFRSGRADHAEEGAPGAEEAAVPISVFV